MVLLESNIGSVPTLSKYICNTTKNKNSPHWQKLLWAVFVNRRINAYVIVKMEVYIMATTNLNIRTDKEIKDLLTEKGHSGLQSIIEI